MAGRLRQGKPEEVGLAAERIAHAARLAEGWVAARETRALVILVARHGVIVLHKAFGTLYPEAESPPVPCDAIFPLASISKAVTATALMCLVEDGLIGLNRSVQEYVPEFSGLGKDAVTVRHLLTHTSGLCDSDLDTHADRRRELEIPPPDVHQSPVVHEYLFLRADAPVSRPPGQEMAYCDYNYHLLGDIIRRCSGKSLAGFARERIFGPLGMADTHFGVAPDKRDRLVRREEHSELAKFQRLLQLEAAGGADGVYSTALDMAIFAQMYLQGGIYGGARVLSPAAITAMTQNQIPRVPLRMDDEEFADASWGLGWNTRGSKRPRHGASLLSPQAFEHNGSGGVYVWVDPLYGLVGVYLSLLPKRVPGLYAPWRADLFANVVTAAVEV